LVCVKHGDIRWRVIFSNKHQGIGYRTCRNYALRVYRPYLYQICTAHDEIKVRRELRGGGQGHTSRGVCAAVLAYFYKVGVQVRRDIRRGPRRGNIGDMRAVPGLKSDFFEF